MTGFLCLRECAQSGSFQWFAVSFNDELDDVMVSLLIPHPNTGPGRSGIGQSFRTSWWAWRAYFRNPWFPALLSDHFVLSGQSSECIRGIPCTRSLGTSQIIIIDHPLGLLCHLGHPHLHAVFASYRNSVAAVAGRLEAGRHVLQSTQWTGYKLLACTRRGHTLMP